MTTGTMSTAAKRLAKAILADRQRETSSRHNIIACFVCGQGMVYKGKRFCSDRCRAGYDLGIAGHEQDWLRAQNTYRDHTGKPMKSTKDGFIIACANCRKDFDCFSGVRCCSTECERRYSERQRNLETMAEAGVVPAAKRHCAGCSAVIPKWRKGRRVSSATRFCSPKCARRHRRAAA